jgi:hypothetical protein
MSLHTVKVDVATATMPFPAGTPAAVGIQVSLANATFSAPSVLLSADPYTTTFVDVPAGDYTVTAQAVDATGAAIGTPVTAFATVAPDTVAIVTPTGLTVTVA